MSFECNKISLNGSIKSYNNTNNTVFCNINNNNINDTAIVFINGLGGTLTSPAYLSLLNNLCTDNKISLFIPQFDSHPSFQTKKIDEDIRNLCELFTDDNDLFIGNNNLFKYKNIFLLGHSTGCQVSLLFIKTLSDFNNKIDIKFKNNLMIEENINLCKELYKNIKGMILQAPVSDVEGMEIVEKELSEYIYKAKEIINDNNLNNLHNDDLHNKTNSDNLNHLNNLTNNDNSYNLNNIFKKEMIFYDNSYYCPYRFLSLYERNNTEFI